MSSVGPEVVIPILSICGVLLLLIVGAIIYLWCHARSRTVAGKYHFYHGFRRRQTLELTCDPVPGTHQAPLEVHLRSTHVEPCDILVDVRHTREQTMDDDRTVRLLGTDNYYGEHFLLYTTPLLFVEAGNYTVCAHTVYPTQRVVGAVHQFSFNVVADAPVAAPHAGDQQKQQIDVNLYRDSAWGRPHSLQTGSTNHARPLPPRIIPEKGEVTTFTPVTIAPNADSATADQIRYSVDGSHPSLLYTGPFTLSLPPLNTNSDSRRMPVVVRALAVYGHDEGLTSDITEAQLVVYAAGHSFFDPDVSAPVARIRALDAQMYFDESRRPPNTSIMYQLVYIGEARQKAKFSRKKGVVYDGKPVPLREDVAFVYAWTFVDEERPHGNANGRRHVRSTAAVYDCCRASAWNRELRDEAGEQQESYSLLPPTICISCREMELFFEDPPAGGIICYTLDSTEPLQPDATTTATHMAGLGFNGATRLPTTGVKEPNMSTHIYRENQPIHVTLLKTEQVFVTARTFIPVVDPSAGGAVTGYRHGERFYRGFTTQ
ncbi:hypothetical protein DQ04_06671010 [Trypanosoma grayi]|uniref:hypothetical protein n=1 Tax=Trypanosoma grayi TaxID=71804 RepID=UPI0004F486D9|nr:hypothetical protein DQ04_06671010 [Trypanosoma grayi]KEG08671.1 hypothetical protein DQ04_06671010 [Trypanosoma grayi]